MRKCTNIFIYAFTFKMQSTPLSRDLVPVPSARDVISFRQSDSRQSETHLELIETTLCTLFLGTSSACHIGTWNLCSMGTIRINSGVPTRSAVYNWKFLIFFHVSYRCLVSSFVQMADIPLLFQLPNAWLIALLSEWLDLPSIGKLDMAISSKNYRPQFLLTLHSMRSTSVDSFSSNRGGRGFLDLTSDNGEWTG